MSALSLVLIIGILICIGIAFIQWVEDNIE